MVITSAKRISRRRLIEHAISASVLMAAAPVAVARPTPAPPGDVIGLSPSQIAALNKVAASVCSSPLELFERNRGVLRERLHVWLHTRATASEREELIVGLEIVAGMHEFDDRPRQLLAALGSRLPACGSIDPAAFALERCLRHIVSIGTPAGRRDPIGRLVAAEHWQPQEAAR